GRPFDGLTLSDWTVLEGVQAEVEDLVSRLALSTAGWCLRAGKGDDAARAVRTGLRACPFDERLYRALLMASESRGDLLGLRSTMEELARVASGGSPGSGRLAGAGARVPGLLALHPQTVALYRELAAGRVPAVGGHPARR
ncbi:MAG TPA: hypothetical protein VL961_02970, partial [Acidimicrobiales bacterium]|nr:hypothetical protein [Acidimicrobiales bacterium]